MEENIKKIAVPVVLVILIVLSFLILKPILMSVIMGIILAYILTPIYRKLFKFTKSKNLSAIIICLVLIILIVIPLWFLTPIAINQSIKIYFASQQLDFITPLKKFFQSFFSSQEFNDQLANTLHTFVTKITTSLMSSLSKLIINLPTLSLHLLVLAFTFFFVLRDGDDMMEYIKTLIPFSKDIQKKILDYTKSITNSVIYGQIIIGFVQGIIVGIGLFVFNVPNALILTIVTIFASVLPIIGPFLVWIPVAVYLFIGGNNVAAWGIIIFGVISSSIDNILRPIIVSKATKMHSAIVLVGMIGGLFFFGIIGLILGPLILAYLLIILEVYRSKKEPGFFIQEEAQKKS